MLFTHHERCAGITVRFFRRLLCGAPLWRAYDVYLQRSSITSAHAGLGGIGSFIDGFMTSGVASGATLTVCGTGFGCFARPASQLACVWYCCC
jgi:hypothetical protein